MYISVKNLKKIFNIFIFNLFSINIILILNFANTTKYNKLLIDCIPFHLFYI